MFLNSEVIIFAPLLIFILGIILFFKFKKRKKSAQSIYKLIDDLEKKYID